MQITRLSLKVSITIRTLNQKNKIQPAALNCSKVPDFGLATVVVGQPTGEMREGEADTVHLSLPLTVDWTCANYQPKSDRRTNQDLVRYAYWTPAQLNYIGWFKLIVEYLNSGKYI